MLSLFCGLGIDSKQPLFSGCLDEICLAGVDNDILCAEHNKSRSYIL